MKFALFMSRPAGRILRIVAGLVLIAVGIALQSVVGIVLIVLGIVFAAVGSFNVCLVAPMLRLPFSGRKIRARAL
ncbi:YgaP-like transmembrane domain [Frigoribacterium sp. UYMn621]|uniref:YgaP-like transmembrane domain n=1 Tax=Frigoribacterium sp. UYMn621 TaxID=3156343 RepID=UPI00339795A9